MDIKVRPVTILLLIIMLVVGTGVGLYHYGMFDSLLSEEQEKTTGDAGQGPVVRKEVNDLVLPLKSSEGESVDMNGQELNESEISQGDMVKAAEEGEQQMAENTVAEVRPEAADEKGQEEPELAKTMDSSASVPEKKTEPENKQRASGVAGFLSIKCEAGAIGIEVPLDADAGKVKWFNLDKPRRLVVDMAGKWESKGKSLYRLKNCGVEKVIVGEHPDKLRFVFYLKQEFPSKVAPTVKSISPGLFIEFKF